MKPRWLNIRDEDIELAKRQAAHLQNVRVTKDQREFFPPDEIEMKLKFIGVLAQLTVADFLQLQWNRKSRNESAPDLGANVKVRAKQRMGHRLFIRNQDPKSLFYVSAFVDLERMQVYPHGWLHGSQRTVGEYKSIKGDPVYWIENGSLETDFTPLWADFL